MTYYLSDPEAYARVRRQIRLLRTLMSFLSGAVAVVLALLLSRPAGPPPEREMVCALTSAEAGLQPVGLRTTVRGLCYLPGGAR